MRHAEKRLDLYINLDTFVGTGDASVTVRVGQEPAATEKWGSPPTGKPFSSPETEPHALSFRSCSKAIGLSSAFVGLTPLGENPITVVFTLTGLSEAIEPMRALSQ